MARGIIYILTNVEIRIQQFYRVRVVAFPFDCYSAFEIDNNDEILSDIRDRFDRTGTEEG